MSEARHHAEWLSLVEVSGPFLSMSVLLRVFPNGLETVAPELRADLAAAHDEWEASVHGREYDRAVHREWVRFVLDDVLGLAPALVEGQTLPPGLRIALPAHGESLAPDFAVVNPPGVLPEGAPRLLVQVVPPAQGLEKVLASARWQASPAARMQALLASTGVRLGLVTNGEHWMLVHVPGDGGTTTYASFYASLFEDEPLTLRAFQSLLGARRLFADEAETPERMLRDSASDQQEVTDQLGLQVRRAVEILVQAIDRIDQDRDRTLLAGFDEKELYEAALTIMMRLVFLLSAEERGLLLPGNATYATHYAIAPLREQLREVADRHGEEVLEHRYDAWCRLLATFRVVHGGVEHEDMRLPGHGGSLFDPDRYPFLEGRTKGTSYRDGAALPLAIGNRTVLHLLEALQLLELRAAGGGAEARRVSFRALDVEQIGHVYEGLLDHTCVRAPDIVLGLQGASGRDTELGLAVLRAMREKGDEPFLERLAKETGRQTPTLRRALDYPLAGDEEERFRRTCRDEAVFEAVAPYAGLVRRDTLGDPVIVHRGSVYVTKGEDRRSSGTHYTPRDLAEEVVRYTLEPLVYEGPAEGKPEAEWTLRPPQALLGLKVCDLAMGSGAFLVAACRYLAERLVESWKAVGADEPGEVRVLPDGTLSRGTATERLLPRDSDERMVLAMRLVADRCLYGVDKNPMAVEMAKLSLWLVTLQKDRPFTFLDHALRCGDSLLGVSSAEQLAMFHLEPEKGEARKARKGSIAKLVPGLLADAAELRRKLEATPDNDAQDVARKVRLLRGADILGGALRVLGDLLVGAGLRTHRGGVRYEELLDELAWRAEEWLSLDPGSAEAMALLARLRLRAGELLGDAPGTFGGARRTFHWPVEFPEVFEGGGGFDAVIGNPPFRGGKLISGDLGKDYREFLVETLAGGTKGHADLCAYFFLRAHALLGATGGFGLLATNTIAQGDTREVGLDQIVADGATIPRALASRKWPGTANLEVAEVWVRRGAWAGGHVLDGRSVPGITAYLTAPGAVEGKPFRLKANERRSFQGSNVLGMGFIMRPEEAAALIAKDRRNGEVLFPYLNGEDLNSRPDQSASRWVINFRDWPLDRESAPPAYEGPVAADYPDSLAIVREQVKPERDKLGLKDDASARTYARLWWQFGRKGLDLYATIAGMERVLIRARVANLNSFSFVPTGTVFSDATVVVASARPADLATLQCTFHGDWVQLFASSMRTDVRYTPSDCFDTFPLPATLDGLDDIGALYHEHRQAVMRARGEGLTRTYNRFHDPDQQDDDLRALRALHVELDQAVARAYGWSDLDLGHGFHDTKQGRRYTISEPARREVLGRLLTLNHARHAEEVAAGLHDGGKGKKKEASAVSRQPSVGGPARSARHEDLPLFAATAAAPPEAAPAPEGAAEALLAALATARAPVTKRELLELARLAEEQWASAIQGLLASGQVVKEGQARGTRYRLAR